MNLLLVGFYVAFSGGKDSVVALDLVQRALPHNSFKVIFGDTDMEFPTTLRLVEDIRDYCKSQGIDFYDAKAKTPAEKNWEIFGPPARKIRWCCTVHKTAPVINKLEEVAVPIIEITQKQANVEAFIVDGSRTVMLGAKEHASIKIFVGVKSNNIAIKLEGHFYDANQTSEPYVYAVDLPSFTRKGKYA